MAPSTPPPTGEKIPVRITRPIPHERVILYFAALHKDGVSFASPYKTMSEISGGRVTAGALATQFGEAKKIAKELVEGKYEFTGVMTAPNSGKGKKRAIAAEDSHSEKGAESPAKKKSRVEGSDKAAGSTKKSKVQSKGDPASEVESGFANEEPQPGKHEQDVDWTMLEDHIFLTPAKESQED